MDKKKLFKTKSNFTLKRLHQSGGYGTIYERDYTTIAGTTTSPEGQIPVYSSPSFKLSVRGGYNGQKKYNYGNWVINTENCANASDKWTLKCLPAPNSVDSKVILKPDSKKITDFVYFSSASDLIRATLSDIAAKFPAEIYVTDKTVNDSGLLLSDSIPSDSAIRKYGDYYLVDNPFMIDLTQLVVPEDSTVSPLRYMCASFDKYNVVAPDGTVMSVQDWVISSELFDKCIENGAKLATVYFKNAIGGNILLEIGCFNFDNNIIYLSKNPGYRLRPKDEVSNIFFDNLDDFEKILLNQYTDYTATFETYYEDNEKGWQMTEKKYKWPLSKGGWNISVNGKSYKDYADSLSQLALGYDSLFTDMIWRTMTHEAIVNLDLTLLRNGDMVQIPNSSKLKMMFSIFGRQFDEIKKYADNIKRSNTISYDQENNVPDYFLSDALANSGWEVKNILNTVPNDIITTPMYGARTIGYSAGDANYEFMRRLKLNSKRIFAKKGTKQGIEDLLAVFGYHSTDWIRKSLKMVNIPATEPSLRKAYMLYEYSYVVDGYNKGNSGNTLINDVQKINQLKDSFPTESINNDEVIDAYYGLPVAEVVNPDKPEESTLVPWFDRDLKYDGDIYFQMKGGWSRYQLNDGKSQYDYTASRIHFVPSLNDLFNLTYGSIDNEGLYYVESEGSYFKIKDIERYQELSGWYGQNEIDAKEISDAELIIDDNKGNNPHTGQYDMGSTYLKAYGDLFINSTFTNARTDETEMKLSNCGFNINRQDDSTKCVYLSDSIGSTNKLAFNSLRPKSGVKPKNLFNGEIEYSEVAGTSIMNNKEFHIVFDDAHKDFILNDILPYLKQMIPATTIFSYSFEKLTGDEKIQFEPITMLVCEGGLCPIYGIV